MISINSSKLSPIANVSVTNSCEGEISILGNGSVSSPVMIRRTGWTGVFGGYKE